MTMKEPSMEKELTGDALAVFKEAKREYHFRPKILECPNPEDCEELHNEGPVAEHHHYGCECQDCMRHYWSLKH